MQPRMISRRREWSRSSAKGTAVKSAPVAVPSRSSGQAGQPAPASNAELGSGHALTVVTLAFVLAAVAWALLVSHQTGEPA
jgi:hypothetical protein